MSESEKNVAMEEKNVEFKKDVDIFLEFNIFLEKCYKKTFFVFDRGSQGTTFKEIVFLRVSCWKHKNRAKIGNVIDF